MDAAPALRARTERPGVISFAGGLPSPSCFPAEELALAADPGFGDAAYNLGMVEIDLGRWDRAAAAMGRAGGAPLPALRRI